MEFDNVLRIIGEFGPYQKRLYILLNLAIIPAACQMLMNVFIGREPQWICTGSKLNQTCPVDAKSCGKVQYSSTYSSIASEWYLICGNAYKVHLTQSIFMVGALLGGLILGMFADRYGRRLAWRISYAVMVLGSLATPFSTSLDILYIARFCTGIGAGGALLTGFVLVTEIIGPSYRGITGALSSCFFTFGQMLLPAFAYYFVDWRKLSFILSLLGAVFIFFIRSVPESPRWLMIVGRVSEAEDILSDIALYNGLALPKTLLQIGRPIQLSKSYRGCLELCRNCYITKKTFIIASIWFTISVVYYGLSFNASNIGGNIFMNFFFSAAIELPAYFLSFSLINWIGRKRSLFYCMLLSGAACLSCLFVQTGGITSHNVLTTISAVVGKFGIAASFSVIHIFSAELFPTVVRNVGLGVCSMAARIGGIVSPMIVFLGTFTRPLPMMVFGMATFTAAFFSLMLQETLNKPLAETLEDDLPDSEFMDYVQPYKQLHTEARNNTAVDEVEDDFYALVDSDVENDYDVEADNKQGAFI